MSDRASKTTNRAGLFALPLGEVTAAFAAQFREHIEGKEDTPDFDLKSESLTVPDAPQNFRLEIKN